MTRYTIFDPGTGDELGVLVVDDEQDDEHIVELLVRGGYLDPPADAYALDDGYLLSNGTELVVVDCRNEPVITLDLADAVHDVPAQLNDSEAL